MNYKAQRVNHKLCDYLGKPERDADFSHKLKQTVVQHKKRRNKDVIAQYTALGLCLKNKPLIKEVIQQGAYRACSDKREKLWRKIK